MAKKVTSYALLLPPRNPAQAAYQWLYDAMRSEILTGRLSPGRRLPATRELARQYGLARGTIVSAFEQLASEGYVQGSVGSGTYVSKALPDRLLQVAPRHEAKTLVKRNRRISVSDYGKRATLFEGYEHRPTRAFRANLPALDFFPTELWTKITARRLRRISTRDLMGCDPLGHFPLRQAIGEYLSTSRGVRCAPEQIAIVSGVQEALDLTARLFLNPGDRVCMENPGYPGAAQVFLTYRAKLTGLRVDEEGIAIQELPLGKFGLVYVTPGHQFPLGTTMTLGQRLQLLAWAGKSGAMIFEDDYDSEYRYSGRPIPALQGLDASGIVVYAGSFSKVLFPALRLGYLVLPKELLKYFEAALSLTVRHTPMLEQLVLNDFIREGHFGRHLRRMREIYAGRLRVLLEEAQAKLAGLLRISNIEAGLQTVGWLEDEMNAESAAVAAEKYNVSVTPLGRYCWRKVSLPGLQLGFAAIDETEIRRGVRDLAVVLEAATRGARNSY